MRRLVALAFGVVSVGSGAGLVACIDLFHATADVLTACELDAQTPGCGDAGAAFEASDFCAWDETTAGEHAEHACAWLGACETPLGEGAFGSCMFEALLAYDCRANPNHPVTPGERHTRWDCLWQAKSCADVAACVFPNGPPQCHGVGTGCASEGDAEVRVECAANGGVFGEDCALWGQTCAGIDGSAGFCRGQTGAAGLACSDLDSCTGGVIHSCDGGDVGIDCNTNGAGKCAGFPAASNVEWIACLPSEAGPPCTPVRTATCSNGVATLCLTGVTETIDCASLLGDNRGCTPGELHPNFDWTAACVVDLDAGTDAADGGADAANAGADADAAPCVESCNGSYITGCTRGTSYTLDCTHVGLGPCHLVTADPSEPQRAACSALP